MNKLEKDANGDWKEVPMSGLDVVNPLVVTPDTSAMLLRYFLTALITRTVG